MKRLKMVKLFNGKDTAIISPYNCYFRLYSDKECFFREFNHALNHAVSQGYIIHESIYFD